MSSEVLLNGEDVSDETTRDVAIKAANYALQSAADARESKAAARLAQQASQRTERHVETAVATISGRVSQIQSSVREMSNGLADRDASIARELAELRLSVQTALERVARTSAVAEEVREKAPSKHDLEKFAQKLDHVAEVLEETTSPGMRVPSDRVRQIVKTEMVVEEHGQMVQKKKARQDARTTIRTTVIAGIILAAVLSAGGIAWTVARAFAPAVAMPRAVPGASP